VTDALTLELPVHVRRRANGRRELQPGAAPPPPVEPVGRVPRISRLMALAIKVDHLIRRGEIADYAEAARLGHVTRARMTQIMNLLNLAPDIQEGLLFLSSSSQDSDPLAERYLRDVVAKADWANQRRELAVAAWDPKSGSPLAFIGNVEKKR